MNLLTQFCALIVLLTLLSFYCRRRKISMATTYVFLGLFIASFVTVITDILSVWTVCKLPESYGWLKRLTCRLYLVSIQATIYFCFLYICVEIYKRIRFLVYLISFTTFGVCIAFFVVPIYYIYEISNSIMFSFGPGPNICYIYAFIISSLTFILIFSNMRRMNTKRVHTILMWIVLVIFAAVFQMNHKHILVITFANTIGLLIVFLAYENPELNLDRMTNLFSSAAFNQYYMDSFRVIKERKLSICAIKISQNPNIDEQTQQNEFETITIQLTNQRHIYSFKISHNLIYVCSKRYSIPYLKNLIENKIDALTNEHKIFSEFQFAYLDDVSCVTNQQDLNDLISFGFSEASLIKEKSVIIDSDILTKFRKERFMIEEIKLALMDDRIKVYYQPIYSTKEKRIVSAEALVRILKYDGTIIPPFDFIEIAEQNNLINQVGLRVFEETCKFWKLNDLENKGLKYIEVNLSTIQCENKNLCKTYLEVLETYRVAPKFINLEITETATIEEKNILLQNMKEMISNGINFSLDDFGTGQANLNYICEMPVKIVKFDKTMIDEYFKNTKTKYVMNAAINMIKGLGLEIVAEGIETQEQFDALTEIGIDYLQGYYFSKPLTNIDFLDFISKE